MDEIKNKLDENKNSDSSLSINGTPTGTERQLSHSSGDTLRPFPLRHREHTGEESKAYSEFIDSYFNVIKFPDKKAEARARALKRILKYAKSLPF